MSYKYNIPLVSQITSPSDYHKNQFDIYSRHYYEEAKVFVDAVCSALGDVSYVFGDYGTAFIYRPTDTHILGEIGFKCMGIRDSKTENKKYYVRAYAIRNEKVGSKHWQHNSYSFKSLSDAVKCAKQNLKPLTPTEVVTVTIKDVRDIIQKEVSTYRAVRAKAVNALFGSGFYNSSFDGLLYQEMRHTVFASPELNKQISEFCKAQDGVLEAEAIEKRGICYVRPETNDVVHVQQSQAYVPSAVTHHQYAELPEWIRGRIAVLSMLKPETYVLGVGLRLDDKIFYVVQEEANEV